MQNLLKSESVIKMNFGKPITENRILHYYLYTVSAYILKLPVKWKVDLSFCLVKSILSIWIKMLKGCYIVV